MKVAREKRFIHVRIRQSRAGFSEDLRRTVQDSELQ